MCRRTRVLGLIAVMFLFVGCHSSSSDPQAGGFSNWLQACEQDADCGDASCICGVCTLPCDEDASCDGDGRMGVCLDPQASDLDSSCGEVALERENARGLCFAACDGDGECGRELQCLADGCVSQVGLTVNTTDAAMDDASTIDGPMPIPRPMPMPTVDGGLDGSMPRPRPMPMPTTDSGLDGSVVVVDDGGSWLSDGGRCLPADGGPGDNCDDCPIGADRCDGMCISVEFDPDNCGACGESCDGFLCDFGSCRGATGFQQRRQIGGVAGLSVTDPSVTADAAGNVLAVWTQSAGTFHDVWAARYEVAVGDWLAPERIAAADFDSPFELRVASGDSLSMVAWVMQNGTRDVVNARWLDWSTGTWSDVTEIPGQSLYNAGGLSLVMAPGGDGMATWRESSGFFFSRYDAQAGAFSDAQPFAGTVFSDAGGLVMHAHDDGDVTIAWINASEVSTARYDAQGDAWGMATPIDSVNPGRSSELRLSGAPGDGVFAMWRRENRLWWSRYNDVAGAWELAGLTRNGPQGPSRLSVGMDAMGVGYVTYFAEPSWQRKTYDPASDRWSDAEMIDVPRFARPEPFPLEVHPSGDVVAATSISGVAFGLFDGAGASAPLEVERIGSAPSGIGPVRVSFAGAGHAVYVWRQRDGIWAHRYE